jgi:uncharacterized metal-binding protein
MDFTYINSIEFQNCLVVVYVYERNQTHTSWILYAVVLCCNIASMSHIIATHGGTYYQSKAYNLRPKNHWRESFFFFF